MLGDVLTRAGLVQVLTGLEDLEANRTCNASGVRLRRYVDDWQRVKFKTARLSDGGYRSTESPRGPEG